MPRIKKKHTKKENTQSEEIVIFPKNENQEETRDDAEPLFSLTAKNGQNYLLRLSTTSIDVYAYVFSVALLPAMVISAMIFSHVFSELLLAFAWFTMLMLGVLILFFLPGLLFSNFLYIDLNRNIAIYIKYFLKKDEVPISDIKLISKEASFRKTLSESGSKAVESEELSDLKIIKYKISIGKNCISYKTHEKTLINGIKFKKEIEDIQEEIKGDKINKQLKSNFLAGKGYTLSAYFNVCQYFENGIKYKFLHQPIAALYTFFFYPILFIHKIILTINLMVLNLYFSQIMKNVSGSSGEANHQYTGPKSPNENIKRPTLSPLQALVAILTHFIYIIPGLLPSIFLITNPFNIRIKHLGLFVFVGFIIFLLNIYIFYISRVMAKKIEISVNLPTSSEIGLISYSSILFVLCISLFLFLIGF